MSFVGTRLCTLHRLDDVVCCCDEMCIYYSQLLTVMKETALAVSLFLHCKQRFTIVLVLISVQNVNAVVPKFHLNPRMSVSLF